MCGVYTMETANISSSGSCDFISKLPDPILHHILGLLNPKEAVQTCMLSKRWEHLWTFLPSLNFSFDDFGHDDYYHGYCFDRNDAGRFAKFVNNLLLRREHMDLDVFRLSCEHFDYSEIERDWIHYAFEHNTRVLHLSLSDSVPPYIYTCTSLEELYLNDNHAYNRRYFNRHEIDSSVHIVNLPNLRKLTIYRSALTSNDVKNLLSGCTILEFLRLDCCFLFDCVIAHKSLKHLAIVNCLFEETQLVISTPNLLSFLYDDGHSFRSPSNTTLNMPSLASSYLTIQDYSRMKCFERMTTSLSFLTNVEFLELHFIFEDYWLEELAVLPFELPIFSNLKNLTVSIFTFSCFQLVNCILKSSPNLEKLTMLQEGYVSQGEEGASTNESTNISSTIAIFPYKKLKIVVVKYWIYNQMIQQLENTLKDGAQEFENLKIHWSMY
ncbi:F-box/LRR-repeat protein At4g14103-like isoform X2 [Carex rostrata]